MRANRVLAPLGVALVAALILSACGGSGIKASSSASVTAPPSTTTTIAWRWPPDVTTNSATDLVKANNIALMVTDLPTGWNTHDAYVSTAPNGADLDQAFVQCMFGAQPSPLTSYVVSQEMASQDGNTIGQSFTRSVLAAANARSDFANFKAARGAQCTTAMYVRQSALQTKQGVIGKKFGLAAPPNIPSDPLPSPENSNDVIGIRIYIAPSDAPTTFEDVFAFGAGHFETVLVFQSSTANPDGTAEAQAIKAVKARSLAAAAS